MNLVFGASLELSMVREINLRFEPDRWFPSESGYYGSLFRYQDRSVFDRAATLMALADDVAIPYGIDWAMPRDAQTLDFGITQSQDHGDYLNKIDNLNTFRREINRFSSSTAGRKIFKKISHCSTEQGSRQKRQDREFAASQFLENLLLNCIYAAENNSLLALTELDIAALRQMEFFNTSQVQDLRLPIPMISELKIISDSVLPRAIVNFQPHDPSVIPAVRNDEKVRRYSKKIGDLLISDSGIDSDISFVSAFRELYEESDRIRNSSTVINVFSGVFNLIVPFSGFLLKGFSQYLDGQSQRKAIHLIGARMAQLNTIDYLNRYQNYR